MKNKTLYLISATILLFTLVIISGFEVHAQEDLFWSGNAYSTTGAIVSTPTLVSGTEYRIVAATVFMYNQSSQLEADAQYYTTDNSGWNWINYYPAPNGHSFLLIDGGDVNWGPFSNGDTNHQYSIIFVGKGVPITFQIYDWIDQDFSNNYCHIGISIYQVQAAPTPSPLTVKANSPSGTSVTVAAGNLVNYTATVSGGIAPYNYQWVVYQSPTSIVNGWVSGGNSANLQIPQTVSGTYSYFVIVFDSNRQVAVSNKLTLTVTSSSTTPTPTQSTTPTSGPTTAPTIAPTPTPVPTTISPSTTISLGILVFALLLILVLIVKRRLRKK